MRLVLAKTRVQLNVGASTAPIGIVGGVPPLRAALSAPIADVRLDPANNTVVLRGSMNGTATLTVTDASGDTVTASVLVGPNAGFAPTDVTIALTGNPTDDFAQAQMHAALLRAVQPLPGAVVVPGSAQLPASLAPGERIDAPVRFHVDGKDRYVDVDGIATAHLSIATPTPIPPTVLFYSDDPEELTQDGVLFRGTLTRERPVRLYYYHQTKVPNESVVIALDTPAGAARVNVIGRGAGPNPAVMYVGQTATYRYLDDHARSAGVDLDVPIGTPLLIFTADTAMKTGDLIAGALDLALTDGSPVRVSVVALSPEAQLATLLGSDELLSDGKQRRGSYDIAQPLVLALAYAAGAPDPPAVTVGGGDPPIPNLRPGGRSLAGDYGVLRNVNLSITNPTQAPATVYLYEKPIGYPVTTTINFTGDPSPTRLQCAKQPERYLVRAFNVPANGNATISGTYMTDGGSTYPLDFGLTSTPPSPLPVSMTAPDGCFPKPAGAAPYSPVPATSPTPLPAPTI
ncbi:MAG: hypothetical protein GIX03_10850 [Candidatus Eremiobacteraeota bacterium]|nr:hypothetical protein [Candidatus Eremiobacteraeota bacterium]MBC5803469.1 hypothetical protein [Candidatus Eremiobacteraeota bacterium]MBC5821047.1 hypothetical protein [Candidatus Eremiobacteraeota bacterium]